MNVLLTGAFGTVGTAIIEHLADESGYNFTYLDRKPHPEFEAQVADVADRSAIEPAFEGQDAVVHLAGNPSPGAPWGDVLESNIIGTYNVLSAAAQAGVERVMFASTNHVMGLYRGAATPGVDHEYDSDLLVRHDDPPKPDSYYAVSKLAGEHLGQYHVEGRGAPERFYAIRIGWVLDPPYDHPYGGAERAVDRGDVERGSAKYEQLAAASKGLWCSRRDIANLTECVLGDDSVGFDVFYARSAGSDQWLDIEHARTVLGYEPRDDADTYEPPAG